MSLSPVERLGLMEEIEELLRAVRELGWKVNSTSTRDDDGEPFLVSIDLQHSGYSVLDNAPF